MNASRTIAVAQISLSVVFLVGYFAMLALFITGKVATPTEPYYSIKASDKLTLSPARLLRKTLYIGAPDNGSVAEIIFWR